MAVTITLAELTAALRLSDAPEEQAEATRLLAYATDAVLEHVPIAPDSAHNESLRRLAGYLYDMPEAARGSAYANAMRNSGAARMLLPYRIHRAGYADAVEAAQQAVGTTGNPVIDVDISGTTLTVTFADFTTETHTLPAGGGGTVDQTARDAAATVATDLEQALVGLSISGTTLSAARQGGGAAATVILPTGGMGVADGVIVAATVNVAAETVTVTTSTNATVMWDLTAILDVVRTLITAAQTAADAAQTEVTTHETNHPSGVPDGNSQRRQLKWNPNSSAWDAVSDVETIYYGAVGAGDYTHVAAALAAGLNTAGSRIATTSYMLYKGFGANVLRNDHLAALWAAISTSPVVFVLAPAHTDWINNFGLTVRTGPLDGVVTDDFVYINGTAYDIKLATYPGVEADVGSAQWRYTTPAAVYTISQTAA